MLPVLLLASSVLASAGTSTLIDFEIEDQFKRKHRDEDFAGRVVLVLAADRQGSAFCDVWGQPVRAELDAAEEAKVGFLSVAKTTGVPFFLKGTVRGKFPKEKERWLLLDWKGTFHKSYDLASETCNALVFDSSGALVHRDHGNEPEGARVEALIQAIRAALPQEAGSE